MSEAVTDIILLLFDDVAAWYTDYSSMTKYNLVYSNPDNQSIIILLSDLYNLLMIYWYWPIVTCQYMTEEVLIFVAVMWRRNREMREKKKRRNVM